MLDAAALERMGGNVARLARELDIPRSTLRYRMRQVGLSEPSPRPQPAPQHKHDIRNKIKLKYQRDFDQTNSISSSH